MHGGWPPTPDSVHYGAARLPDELLEQVREVLSEMSIVAEAPAANLHEGRSSHSKPGSKEPTATGDDLFTTWAQRFADQTDPGRVRTLLLLARRALEERRARQPSHTSPEHPEQRESEIEMEGRIIAWFKGVPAVEAAVYESASGSFCRADFIRRVRKKNDHEPELGHPVEASDSRTRRVMSMAAGGMNQKAIAKELNVHQSTVSRILAKAETPQHRRQAA